MKKRMTPDEFLAEMKKIDQNGDTEMGHVEADSLMCDLLKELGYEDGVKIFRKMKRWYA